MEAIREEAAEGVRGLKDKFVRNLTKLEHASPRAHTAAVRTARKVIEFRIDPQVQARAGELAEKANEGRLTPDECAEYEALVNFTDFLSVFKLKARCRLGTR
ncbi:MAG: hypothetical protein IT167_04135 [Bryobacterales bacterium]|nr:hypothetical protein [Bryobacterales bacterium]